MSVNMAVEQEKVPVVEVRATRTNATLFERSRSRILQCTVVQE